MIWQEWENKEKIKLSKINLSSGSRELIPHLIEISPSVVEAEICGQTDRPAYNRIVLSICNTVPEKLLFHLLANHDLNQ